MTHRRLLLGLLLAALLLTTAVGAQDAVASVNTGALNVRTGPGLTYPSFRALPYGFGVQMIGRNDASTWILIRLTDGQEGWVSAGMIFTNFRIRDLPIASRIVTAPLPTGTVDGILALTVYSEARSNSATLTTLTPGQTVTLLGRNFDATWARISAGNVTGWVEARFLVTNVPVRGLNPADGGVTAPIAPPANTGGPVIVANYTVRAGDTLASIATRYGTTVEKLMQANNITNANRILAGQRLVIVR